MDIFQQTLLRIWTSKKINISPYRIQICYLISHQISHTITAYLTAAVLPLLNVKSRLERH